MGWKKETVLKSIAANKVTYDNSGSSLLSNNVQDAIDELAAGHIVDAGFKDYPAWQDFTFSSGVTEVTLTQDENADVPEPITDTNKIVSAPTSFSVINPVTKKAVFKEGSFLTIESNRVKVVSYNPLTGTVTLNFAPKTDFRITYLIEYLNTQVPNGKQISAENGEVIISNVDEAIEIQFDNALNGFDAEEVQSAIIEAYTKTRYTNYGVVKQPTTTKNGDGTVTIAGDGEFIFNTAIDGTGINVKLNVPQAILTPPADTISYLYADYNNGSPFFAFTTTAITFRNNATLLPVIRVIKETGFDPHFEEYDEYAVQLPNKMLYKDIILRNFERLNGLLLTTEGIRKSKVAAGVASFGVQFFNLAENLADTSGLLIEYYLTGGAWNRSTVTGYDSLYYSDGTNRQNLGNSKWVAKYFWRDVGTDNEVYFIHGNQYNSQADATNEKVPAAPPLMTAHSIYVGKIVIEQGAATGTAIPRDWDAAIQSGTVTVHNGLSEIQGGTSTERYHLTAAEHSSVSGLTTPLVTLLADMKINGIAETEKSKYTAKYDPVTRVLTMNLSANSYYYVDGVRYAIAAGNYTFTAHANVTGTYFYYFDSAGVKQVSATAWDILSTAQLFYVYFNATTQYYEIGYELHGVVMDSATHKRMHLADGTKYVSGGALSGYTIQTDTLAAVQFGISQATYQDEDIPLVSDAFTDGSNYRILSRNVSGEWALTTSPLPYLNTIGGTNNPIYNQAGTALTEITTNDRYFNSYVVLTNFIGTGRKTVVIPGQTLYTTLADAQNENVASLSLGGLPFQEFIILHKITFRYRNTYSITTAKTRIEAKPIQITVNSATISGFAGNHSSLSMRDEPNSHPLSAINGNIANAIIFEKSDGTGLGESSDFTWNDSTKILSAKNITTEKLNELTFTKQTNGFTIAGGTASKTLTVPLDASVSGTNTGDQTSIVGITGTIAQFNTALTDGDFATLAGSEVLTNKTLTSPIINTTASGTGITTTGESSKLVKTDALGDIYERGNRVAEDFKIGQCATSLYFNGTSSTGDIADSNNLSFTDGTKDKPFSIVVKLKNLKSENTTRYIVAKGVTGQYEYEIGLNTSNTLQAYLLSLDGTKWLRMVGDTIPDNFSGTIAITYDGNATTIKPYINGIEKTPIMINTNYTNMQNGTSSVYIGNRAGGGYVQAEYCEIDIYNSELSSDEIRKVSYDSIPYYLTGAKNDDLTLGNGSFATDTTGWWVKEKGTLTWNSGTQDATFTVDGTVGINDIYKATILSVGKRYRISFNAKSSNLSTTLNAGNGNGAYFTAIKNPTLRNTYQNYVFEGISRDTLIVIYFGSGLVAGTQITLDDIVVQQIGNIANLNPTSIGNGIWYDESGNGHNATLLNTITLNKPVNIPYLDNTNNFFSGNVGLGQTTLRTIQAIGISMTSRFQIEGLTINDGFSAIRNVNADAPVYSFLGKSRGSTVGGVTALTSDDAVANLGFVGADGTNLIQGASIKVRTDGTISTGNVPMKIIFATGATGSTPTDRFEITNAGNRSRNTVFINTGAGDNLALGTNNGAGLLIVRNASSFENIRLDGNANEIKLSANVTASTGLLGKITAYNQTTPSNEACGIYFERDSASFGYNGAIIFKNTNGAETARFTSNRQLGIGTNAPITTNGGVDIASGGIGLVVGADNSGTTRTNALEKIARIACAHYTIAEKPFTLIRGTSNNVVNEVAIGGGTGLLNSATSVAIYTASNTTTLTGTPVLVATSAGNIVLGAQSALATNATDGFTYIPTCAGAPTGSATAYTGKVPMVVDTTNNRLYFRVGTTWRYATLT